MVRGGIFRNSMEPNHPMAAPVCVAITSNATLREKILSCLSGHFHSLSLFPLLTSSVEKRKRERASRKILFTASQRLPTLFQK